jgi:hypothetical protein
VNFYRVEKVRRNEDGAPVECLHGFRRKEHREELRGDDQSHGGNVARGRDDDTNDVCSPQSLPASESLFFGRSEDYFRVPEVLGDIDGAVLCEWDPEGEKLLEYHELLVCFRGEAGQGDQDGWEYEAGC